MYKIKRVPIRKAVVMNIFVVKNRIKKTTPQSHEPTHSQCHFTCSDQCNAFFGPQRAGDVMMLC